MIDTFKISTAVTAGAGTSIVAYTVEESLQGGCQDPSINVSAAAGVPFKSGASIIVPLTMAVTATYVNGDGVVTKTISKTEHFLTGYEYTSLPSNVTVAVQPWTLHTIGSRCRTHKVRIQGAVNVTVTA